MTLDLLTRWPATVSPRDIFDMTGDLGEVWIAIKYAAAALGEGAEHDDRLAMAQGLADLKAAHAALGRLVQEIEGEIT